MKIDITEKHLPVYEALASKTRLTIIQLLANTPMNVKELAASLNLSSAIMTMHIRKLETAGIIKTDMVQTKGWSQKICSLVTDIIEVKFPNTNSKEHSFHYFSMPVGHYTDFEISPTCGLATEEKLIGFYDDPRYFLDPERVNAKLIWFAKGFLEYKIPNHLLLNQHPEELEISLELSSEAPGFNNDWPSDISFYINNVKLGEWTSPGDFGDTRGNFTPMWWHANQYGLLKVIRITNEGTFIDGIRASNITLQQIQILQKQWAFRIAVTDEAKHIGGATIYGEKFGNYNQDIVFRLYYS
jgi:predicted transcriptional regulator